MSQFEVHRVAGADQLVVDIQSDLLSYLETRVVVPLLPVDKAPMPAKNLNPILLLGEASYALQPQFAGAVSIRQLSRSVGSLSVYRDEIVRALDTLLAGV